MNKDILLNTFLQNNSLNMLTQAVSAAFKCPVIVTDNAFQIISAFAAKDYSGKEYQNATAHSELSLKTCTAITEAMRKTDDAHILLTENSKNYFVGKLKCADIELGYVIYVIEENPAPNEKDCFFAEALISKQFYSDRHQNGAPVNNYEEILTELLDGKFADEEVFKIKVSGTFLAHFSPERFALIQFSGNEAEAQKEYLQKDLERRFKASHPIFYKGRVMVFLYSDHDMSFFEQLSKEYSFKIVISPKIQSLYSLKTVYQTVEKTVLYISDKTTEACVAYSEDYALLILLKRICEGTDFINPKIRNLYLYDLENGSELCLTLYNYFICRHSLQDTGERMFTHKNTVQYRIHKIKEQFEIDTDGTQQHTEYLLSLALALVKMGYDNLFIKHINENT